MLKIEDVNNKVYFDWKMVLKLKEVITKMKKESKKIERKTYE